MRGDVRRDVERPLNRFCHLESPPLQSERLTPKVFVVSAMNLAKTLELIHGLILKFLYAIIGTKLTCHDHNNFDDCGHAVLCEIVMIDS